MAAKKPMFDRPRWRGATQTRLPIRHPAELPITTDARVVLQHQGLDVLVLVTKVLDEETFEGVVQEIGHRYKPHGELAIGDCVLFRLSDVAHIDLPPFERLVESGVTSSQAQVFLGLVDDAKTGQLDLSNARERLIAAGYPDAQAEALAETLREVVVQSGRLR